MTTETSLLLQQDLELRFEHAVLDAMRRLLHAEVSRVGVEQQERHTERMVTCHHTVFGEGWLGSLILMMPQTGAQMVASTLKGMHPGENVKGPIMADIFGTLGAAIAIEFGRSFAPDREFTVGMPTVMSGNDIAVSFPWGRHFESRLCFKTSQTPFWAIFRICKREAV